MHFIERRSGDERRRRSLSAYWQGARNPRRYNGRRDEDRYCLVDWYSPRVLTIALAVMALCILDALLTLRLMAHGALEANPIMALLLPHAPHWFAAVKVSVTAFGLVVLVACARMKLFRRVPGEFVLGSVLAAYAFLIGYEFYLLTSQKIPYF